ncbi:hypothetical protein AB0284_20485 [Pseudarthrobacter phenanthrenivorans]|uniref:hypothetical protein n=1 Tax=Pseudarthrobacter phenanthrenivorans TaxID=361575 RepID=UPI00344E61E7
MIGDLLLSWISETGSGTIADFSTRALWLAHTEDLTVSDNVGRTWLRDIASLGHCEVDWKLGRWSVAPPVITRLPLADGLAVLVGARRPRLVRAIENAGLYVEHARRPRSDGTLPSPTTIMIPYNRAPDLENAANDIGAKYVGCAAAGIAEKLQASLPLDPSAPPAYDSLFEQLAGFSPRRWSPASPRDLALPDGLYREQVHGRWRYTLRRDGSWYAAELSRGIFAELARRGSTIIHWQPDYEDCSRAGTVVLDQAVPLPALHSRVLVLCSGFTPRFDSAAQAALYDNVPREIAERVASSLGQTLHISS